MKTKRLANYILSCLTISMLLFSCGSDDSVIIDEEDPQTILEEQQVITTEELTDGNEKT